MNSSKFITAAVLGAMLLTGNCDDTKADSQAAGGSLTKVRVGYIGITCEAPIFSAVENGFFKDEGLDVELVKCDFSKYKDVLALGGFDITHHLIMNLLKPIKHGMVVMFQHGVHHACLRVITPPDHTLY